MLAGKQQLSCRLLGQWQLERKCTAQRIAVQWGHFFLQPSLIPLNFNGTQYYDNITTHRQTHFSFLFCIFPVYVFN